MQTRGGDSRCADKLEKRHATGGMGGQRSNRKVVRVPDLEDIRKDFPAIGARFGQNQTPLRPQGRG